MPRDRKSLKSAWKPLTEKMECKFWAFMGNPRSKKILTDDWIEYWSYEMKLFIKSYVYFIEIYVHICVATYICSESIFLVINFTYWPKLYICIYYVYRILIVDLVQWLVHSLKNTAYLVCMNERCLHTTSDVFLFCNRLA